MTPTDEPGPMARTGTRLVRLLALLQAHRYWPGARLAEQLGVSQRTLRRDIDRLRELGYPVQASRGVAGGYRLRGEAALPPLLLDGEEAVAVAVGLRLAAASGGTGTVTGIEETSVSALSKVIQVLPPRLRHQVEALRPAGPEPRSHVDSSASRMDSERSHVDGRPLPGLASFADRYGRDRTAAPRYHVEVIVHAGGAAIARSVGGWAEVVPVGERRCRVRLDTPDLAEPAMLLAALGVPFEVVGPAELRRHVRALGRHFVRAGEAGELDRSSMKS
jgi:predicted DNA-binding transcriptional regulator YafY